MAKTTFYQTENDIVHDLVDGLMLGGYYLLVTLILPQLALFFGGAIEDQINITKYTLSNSTIAIVYVIFMSVKIANWIFLKSGVNLEIPIFILDPEFSPFRGIRYLKDIIVVILIAVILGSLTVFLGFTQTAIAPLEQQITGTARFIFDIYPVAPSETSLLGAFLAPFGLGIFILFTKVFKQDLKNTATFLLYSFLLIVTFTFLGNRYGVWLHTWRYGASQVAINTVAIFWGLSGFLIALTGSIIPALVLHDVNNAILSAKENFSSSTVTAYISIFFIMSAILLALRIWALSREKEKKSYVSEVV